MSLTPASVGPGGIPGGEGIRREAAPPQGLQRKMVRIQRPWLRCHGGVLRQEVEGERRLLSAGVHRWSRGVGEVGSVSVGGEGAEVGYERALCTKQPQGPPVDGIIADGLVTLAEALVAALAFARVVEKQPSSAQPSK
jgi:hypothetical protein